MARLVGSLHALQAELVAPATPVGQVVSRRQVPERSVLLLAFELVHHALCMPEQELTQRWTDVAVQDDGLVVVAGLR